MKTLMLTDEQTSQLSLYLLISTSYRKGEAEACSKLALRKHADGTPEFPKMVSNAAWWERMCRTIDELRIVIEDAERRF